MTLFGYRLGIGLFTLVGFITLIIFIFGLDPESVRTEGLILFFLSLWVTLSGFFSLLLLSLSVRVIGEKGAMHFVGGALRQGGLCGGLLVTLLLLSHLSLFAWWSAALTFVFFLLLELTFRKFLQ